MIRIEHVIRVAYSRNAQVRDSLAAISAHTAAGDSQAIERAAERLEKVTQSAERDSSQLRRLVRHLGVRTLPEAAKVLCNGGRADAAHLMLELHELVQHIREAHADLALFVEECMSSLHVARESAARQNRGGRLLGSA